jgi:nitroimidazol reductase NimA-like FMN-containing flavoprotein (pyridoxamine 5'-phosphate oxidase superfamily)
MVTNPVARHSEEITVDECLQLLKTKSLGRLAYVVSGKPRLRPLNYGVHQGSVVFRIGYGELLDEVHQRQVVFEVDHGEREARAGWSVIVHGIAEEIWRFDDLSLAREMGLQPWAPGNRDHYVRIVPTAITGRRVG